MQIMNEEMMTIEVAYATLEKQIIISIKVNSQTTVLEAIIHSKIYLHFPNSDNLKHIDNNTPIGIFGKKINVNTYKLNHKDRIEIYRPLAKTPNQRRLERAASHETHKANN